ncbi:MAG: OmpA family protein [Prolixibacteraceae bacterium]|nr:OmpA family protein [Prolixibacteraceae bacterium]
MNTTINNKKGSRTAWSPCWLPIKGLMLSALVLIGITTTTFSQESLYTQPSWKFGLAAGVNYNMFTGSTHELSTTFTPPVVFHEGSGLGLFIAPHWEYHPASSMLGFMVQAGYDNRQGAFNQIASPCNCPADLTSDLSYITIEPSLRFDPFKSGFYLFAGPRLAFNFEETFTYKLGINPDFPDQPPTPDVNGYMSNMNNMIVSMQVGAGFDIPLSAQGKRTQTYFSPFVSYHPYLGQHPRSIETWSVSTIRLGAIIKFGRGEKVQKENDMAAMPVNAKATEPNVEFTVNSPSNITAERRVRETFPVSNFVFFDKGSTNIPDRYVLLQKNQVADFKEDQLEVFKPKNLSGRSDRQMIVYYNVLNILGDRMGKNPFADIWLTGASAEGIPDGLAMAESVKKYLTDVFGIDATRITTQGMLMPRVPSEKPGGTKELDLLREEDRRVSIWSSTPALMMEFQSGKNSPLKTVEFVDLQNAPLDSYVTFNVKGAKKAFTSWGLEIKDENGVVQKFGLFTREKVSMPGKSILGTNLKGNYKATMVGQTKSGKTVKKEEPVQMALWTPSEPEEGMRYSLIFEFGESDAIKVYDKYLSEIVAPKIPKNGTVIIHGHTDNIGSKETNMNLSLARANEVKGIIQNALTKTSNSDVKFEVYGFGENESIAPFVNDTPEGRFYNRTVIIDIIPK